MTEQTPGIPTAEIGNSPLPLPAGASSPTAMVFHDPLSDSLSDGPAVHSYRPLESSRHSSASQRLGPNGLKKRRLAMRANAIEAVARELQLLAQRRGEP
ncbi:hypothetical protein [Arthrobacter sp. NPDC057013]|uniref:hypothetical protein n=1 Tax=Arthrobacter sp. NPDC057013 TaxID=3345999 RepID=UPI003634B25F